MSNRGEYYDAGSVAFCVTAQHSGVCYLFCWGVFAWVISLHTDRRQEVVHLLEGRVGVSVSAHSPATPAHLMKMPAFIEAGGLF